MKRFLSLVAVAYCMSGVYGMIPDANYNGENERSRLLRRVEALENKNNELERKISSEMFTAPDYAHPIVFKAYDGSAQSEAVTAPKNGWMFAESRALNCWFDVEVNGQKLNPSSGLFFGGVTRNVYGNLIGAAGQSTFPLPVHSGDKVKLIGGDYHRIVFYPCRSFDEI